MPKIARALADFAVCPPGYFSAREDEAGQQPSLEGIERLDGSHGTLSVRIAGLLSIDSDGFTKFKRRVLGNRQLPSLEFTATFLGFPCGAWR